MSRPPVLEIPSAFRHSRGETAVGIQGQGSALCDLAPRGEIPSEDRPLRELAPPNVGAFDSQRVPTAQQIRRLLLFGHA
jgi:hypothetical protein